MKIVDSPISMRDLALTAEIADSRHRERLKELTRVREVLLDYFWGENEFGSSEQAWRTYFDAYSMAAALRREAARSSAGVLGS